MQAKNTNNILFLSPFFYPEQISTGKYNTHLVRALINEGCRVRVICSHPLYPEWVPKKSQETINGALICRGGLQTRYPRRPVLRRIILEAWFALHTVRQLIRKPLDCGIMIGVFPPSLFFLFADKLLPGKIKRIAVIHDLQGVMSGQGTTIRRLAGKVAGMLEKRGFQKADKLIFLSYTMQRRAQDSYRLAPRKCVTCYPFVSCYSTGATPGNNLAGVMPADRKHIVYSGALGEKQNPYLLYAFFKEISARFPGIMCHFFSDGPVFEELAAKENRETEGRVFFHSLVPEAHLPELYARSHIQMLPLADGVLEGCIPSKVPNILAAGIPIILVGEEESELMDILRRTGACFSRLSWEPEQMMAGFASFLTTLAKEEPGTRKKRAEKFPARDFSIETVVDAVLS